MTDNEMKAALALDPQKLRFRHAGQRGLATALHQQAAIGGRRTGQITDNQAAALWRLVWNYRDQLPGPIVLLARPEFRRIRGRQAEVYREQMIQQRLAEDAGRTPWYGLDKTRQTLWRLLSESERIEALERWKDRPTFWERINDPCRRRVCDEVFTDVNGRSFSLYEHTPVEFRLAAGWPVRLGLPDDGHE